MRLSFGRQYLAIPGPSVTPDRVLNAMHRASPNIYEGPLHDMVDTLYPDLLDVARTKGNVAVYIGNGHAAWEASLANLFSPGDKLLVLATGRFGEGWAAAAIGLGINAETADYGRQSGVDIEHLSTRLKDDKAHEIKAILTTQTDTATSIRTDIAALRAALDDAGHPALLMVDCIASLGCDRFEMDALGVDVMIAASQKGLMTPPGLCFVWFNEKADQLHQTATLITPYWNWTPRTKGTIFFQKFDGTAPTQHLYGLREALDMLLHEEGLENAWDRHEVLAQSVWAAIDRWADGGSMRMNVADPSLRSHAVTSVSIDKPQGARLRQWCEQQGGVTLGIGLGMETADDPSCEGFFRIAHMGHVNPHMTLGVLAVIDAGLKALDIPHGTGALDAAASVIAKA